MSATDLLEHHARVHPGPFTQANWLTLTRWILWFAGYYVALLGHLATSIGRCHGMTFFTTGMNERNFLQLVMAWTHGLLYAWDNIGDRAMGCSSIKLVPTTCSTSWPPCVHFGLNATTILQAHTHRKLATSCPRHVYLDESASRNLFRSLKCDEFFTSINFFWRHGCTCYMFCKWPSQNLLTGLSQVGHQTMQARAHHCGPSWRLILSAP